MKSLSGKSGHFEDLWYRYGDINHFVDTLNQCFLKQGDHFKNIFLVSYLYKFNSLNDFYENPRFYQCLEQLSIYDEAKITCFGQFLSQTDEETQYDLGHLVDAFEEFWKQWSELAEQNDLPLNLINEKKWSHPKWGSPVVYMERLITILKNARNVSEQLEHLCHKPDKEEMIDGLRNYGDYYASTEEDFKLVSPIMELEYKPEEASEKPFNKEAAVYRTTLSNMKTSWESIVDCSVFENKENETYSYHYHDLYVLKSDLSSIDETSVKNPHSLSSNQTIEPPAHIYQYDAEQKRYIRITNSFISEEIQKINAYRFIGQQAKSINFSEFVNQRDDKLLILLFMGHEQYQGLISAEEFSNQYIPFVRSDTEMAFKKPIEGLLIQKLIELYEAGIIFNEVDGLAIVKQLNRIRYYFYKKELTQFQEPINQFFEILRENPHAMLKCLNALPSDPLTPPFLNDVLITAHLLTLGCLQIASLYKDDLLLFSTLIRLNSNDREKIQKCLLKIAEEPYPNRFDLALRLLLQAKNSFSSNQFLQAFQEIDQLSTSNLAEIITIFEKNRFDLKPKSNSDISLSQNYLSLVFAALKSAGISENLLAISRSADLFTLISLESQLPALIIPTLIKQLKNGVFHHFFGSLQDKKIQEGIQNFLVKMNWVDEARNIEEMSKVYEKINEIQKSLLGFLNAQSFKTNQIELLNLLNQSNLFHCSFEEFKLFLLTITFNNIHNRPDFNSFLPKFISYLNENQTQRSLILEQTQTLISAGLPLDWIVNSLKWAQALSINEQHSFIEYINNLFKENPDDPLLKWLMQNQQLSKEQVSKILEQTQGVKEHRTELVTLLKHTPVQSLDNFLALTQKTPLLLSILVLTQHKTPSSSKIKDASLIIELLQYHSEEELKQLYNLIEISPVTLSSLQFNLVEHQNNYSEFISNLEKSPFGPRSKEQFDTSQVERVVNNFINLNQNSRYTYTYRKQMTEAFLFVNRAGDNLPLYNNKAAKDLSNLEIKELFKQIYNKEPEHLTSFQRRLYALGLIREAMYRTTGKFAYSTQMLAVIDCMMHEGDVVTNIDTGEGKSLIDVMKATFLWLEGGGVDITTASLEDAERDLNIYKSLFSFLDIPHSNKAITGQTKVKDYQLKGINFSTLKQLALFYTQAKVENEGKELWNLNRTISLVMNEADTDFHDDRVVVRYAASMGNELLSEENEWVYDAINEFVNQPEFKRPTTKTQDIRSLRNYLKDIAAFKGDSDFVSKLSNEQLLKWIESAIVVNYVLKPNVHYIIPEDFKTKKIHGKLQKTRCIEILMPDGKTVSGVQYGNGMQQLLYAKLNKELGKKEFIIEPESRVIYSLNIKNMLRYYLSRIGFIWGGSGSVGASHEIERQFKQHGIATSKIQPHLQKNIEIKKPVILKNEAKQFDAIIQKLNLGQSIEPYRSPSLIFFKDIETAERFYTYLQGKCKNKNQPMQCYWPPKNYELAVSNAGESGMITVTTSAFSRNTDMPYRYDVGLNVFETCASLTERDRIQRYGRTGRQGSKRKIYTLFNQEELKGKTREQIQQEIEQVADYERAYYEELYDILYEFDQLVPLLTPKFYKENWAEFDLKAQKLYQEVKKENYSRAQFLEQLIPLFNGMMHQYKIETNVEQMLAALDKKRDSPVSEVVLDKPVQLKECTPPEVIAYHFLSQENTNNILIDKFEIKKQLRTVLDSLNNASFSESNINYIRYLNSTPIDKKELRALHQEVITEFLLDQTQSSQKKGFFSKWFGQQGVLSKLVDNDAYLGLCHVLLASNEENNDQVDHLKQVLKQLFQEYLDYSWFISSTRRKQTEDLIINLDRAPTIDNLIEQLSTSKINTVGKDFTINEQSSLRKLKPLHLMGNSRLHTTLDRALNLAGALNSGTVVFDELIQKLTKEINPEINTPKNIDEASQLDSLKRDPYTSHTVKKSMFTFFKQKEMQTTPALGMKKSASIKEQLTELKDSPSSNPIPSIGTSGENK